MAGAEDTPPAGAPGNQAVGEVLGDAQALRRIFQDDPGLVKLVLSNSGFLESLFGQPGEFRAFLQASPVDDGLKHLGSAEALDDLLSGKGLGGDGATAAAPRRPEETRVAALLRGPSAAVLFREQPQLTGMLARNPAFSELVKVLHPRLYKALLDKAQERFGRDPEMTALIASEREGIFDFTTEGSLSASQRERTGMALLEAVKNGDIQTAERLIGEGVHDFRDDEQQTPLHWAAATGNAGITGLLIERGADIEARDFSGRTPMHLAAAGGSHAVARLLIESGAKPTIQDGLNRTPLHWAAIKGHTPVTALLIAKGADPNAKDTDLKTPLHWACTGGHTILATALIRRGAEIAAQDKWNRTPLHLAASMGNIVTAWRLIDSGADPNASDANQQTPLHLAAESGRTNLADVLIERGADVAAQDSWGRTPLHIAGIYNNPGIACLLIGHGADLAAKDAFLRTPLDHAASLDPDFARKLEEAATRQRSHTSRITRRRGGSNEPQVGG